ncbi:MAG: hypothetical protein AAF933_04470 [Pseudomonadota bacterium]
MMEGGARPELLKKGTPQEAVSATVIRGHPTASPGEGEFFIERQQKNKKASQN